MATRFRCCACSTRFAEGEALCEDWSDPARSFICPACGAYLRRAEGTGMHLLDGRGRARLRRWLPLLPAVCAVLLGMVLMGRIWGERGALAVFLLGLVGLALLAIRTAEAAPPEETVRVDDVH